jgi:Tol biopolymer transport system component
VLTQWFERGRFEWHPDKPREFRVLLGRLGAETRQSGDSLRAPLPAGAVWLHTASRVVANAPGYPTLFLPKGTPQPYIQAAPDGSLLVYAAPSTIGRSGDRLIGINPATGEQRVLYESSDTILPPRFDPTGTALTFTVIGQERWQLMRLQPGDIPRVLRDGRLEDRILAPIAWTQSGILTQYLLWATDAPARDVVLVDPANGSLRTLATGDHWTAIVSPDGRRVARVSGELMIGPDAVQDLTISILDTVTGRDLILARHVKNGIWRGAWSPDGSQLLYVESPLGGQTEIMYVVNADGSGDRTLIFGSPQLAQLLRDVEWRDRDTLVVLATAGTKLFLYDLPATNLTPGALTSLGDFDGEVRPGGSEIVYVPR